MNGPTTAELPVGVRDAMRRQYSKPGEDVGVLSLLDEISRLEGEVAELREAAADAYGDERELAGHVGACGKEPPRGFQLKTCGVGWYCEAAPIKEQPVS